ncbi:hypothetical protein B9Z65_9099 [Elsinoe australis]|uniref:Glycerophosphocholine acyltransferase 1 n=1 Tax=Elsinoe australis TaxID=40998 RepID=A0A2P8ABR2_9PEZI|nr:hypothetical protein B9Z65_9099 [Elsinoe australis]
MSDPIDIPGSKPKSKSIPVGLEASNPPSLDESPPVADYLSAGYSSSSGYTGSTPGFDGMPITPGSSLGTPGGLSRTTSHTNLSDDFGDESFPPLDRLTVFDVLENLALPQHFERIQERVRKQQQRLQRSSKNAKEKVVQEWRRRVPTPDEQLEKYRKRMRENVDRLSKRWNDSKYVTVREKVSFIGGVLDIFISGYMIGAFPEYFHIWYTAQLVYFMPIRWYTYHKIGFHYFLADLCYFVNFLMVLSIWFFPQSKRLFISTFCLAFGNNAVAIAMWRNSLVFHSLDKVTSLFIHIMPCVTLHCIIHLLPESIQREKFPAIHTIKYSPVSSPEHYTLRQMVVWATVPYFVWQISYHLLITVRRREKIAAGRPTSFTWLRKSYAKNFLGKFVLSLPDALQEPAFMGIQYTYALLTMLPCPFWFWYRWASASFLMIVFTWATYNGATFYIDVFGKRMEKELEALKREVRQMNFDEGKSPMLAALKSEDRGKDGFSLDAKGNDAQKTHNAKNSVDRIPLLDKDLKQESDDQSKKVEVDDRKDEGNIAAAATTGSESNAKEEDGLRKR